MTTRAAGARGELRLTAGKLRRAAHALLLLGRDGLRSGYGGGHGSPALLLLPVLRFRRLAHAALLLLLVLSRRTRGRSQLGAQVLVLAQQPGQLGFDLVEEGIDLVLVIAFAQTDGRELLVPHVLGGQGHLFTST